MNIAETLIGKNMKAHPEALGLYIGLDEMYIAQSVRKDGSVTLESLLRVPIAAVDPAVLKPLELNDGFFGADNWLDALSKVAAKKKWINTRVVVSLSPAFSLLRHFVIPTQIERKHWKQAIPFQARKYIHFPFEKTMYSYYVYEFETAASKQKRLGVIFTMTPKTIIEKLEKGLRGLGLDPVAIEPSPLSLSRSFIGSDKEAVDDTGRIYSFFGSHMASFVFTNNNAPVLLREVEISGSLPMERRRLEITNCTEFIAKQLERDPFDEAVIMGQNMDNWTALLEAESKKPVRKWDLSEVYGVETKSAGEMAAIGASMKFYDEKGPDLDYIKRNRLSDYEFNAGAMFWKITGVVVLLFLLLLGKSWMGMLSEKKNLAEAKRKNAQPIEDFRGLTATQIQNNLNRIRTQNNNLEQLLKVNVATPFLVDIAETIPPQVWLEKISYKEEFPSKNADTRSVTLEGVVYTGDPAKDIDVGKKFRDTLSARPSFMALCNGVPDFQYNEVDTRGGRTSSSVRRGLNSDAAVKNGTSFTYTCKKGGASR